MNFNTQLQRKLFATVILNVFIAFVIIPFIGYSQQSIKPKPGRLAAIAHFPIGSAVGMRWLGMGDDPYVMAGSDADLGEFPPDVFDTIDIPYQFLATLFMADSLSVDCRQDLAGTCRIAFDPAHHYCNSLFRRERGKPLGS